MSTYNFGAVKLRDVLAVMRLKLSLCFEISNAVISSTEDRSWKERAVTIIILPSKPAIATLKSLEAVDMHSRKHAGFEAETNMRRAALLCGYYY